ncbi:MAG: K(+)-transporting ATPase subunit F [Gemmatimonadales bacterium]|nr:K(+)-transporting ATPase subunit F [Gemmatimonadales bacterium]
MTAETVVAFVLAILIAGYLVCSLLRPERF